MSSDARPFAAPVEAGISEDRWSAASGLLAGFCSDGTISSATMIAGRGEALVQPQFFGRQTLNGEEPLRDDALFLVASITKPIVASAALLLVERGQLTLPDKVTDYIPEFSRNGKSGVRLRHLLTHTSGLPDMLPNNVELRKQHSPLSAFVDETCEVELEFPVGRAVRYQSMGLAILGEIIQRVSGVSCAEFVRREIFEPLGMVDSWLGLPESAFAGDAPIVNRVTEVLVPDEMIGEDWNWNSRYWRMLGAPWGGLITTPVDLARFCQMMLGHPATGLQILSPATIAAATRNQLEVMADVPEVDRRTRPWGLGWRLNWPAHSANFGDFLGSRTYGHWGATGTVLWIDPEQESFAVILTTKPQEPHGTWLAKVSNAITASFV
ncbi:MAG: serine hydrolase [Planctomycetota bacterium]|nr:serine hydrolase [Planctomycetota bacterium]